MSKRNKRHRKKHTGSFLMFFSVSFYYCRIKEQTYAMCCAVQLCLISIAYNPLFCIFCYSLLMQMPLVIAS